MRLNLYGHHWVLMAGYVLGLGIDRYIGAFQLDYWSTA